MKILYNGSVQDEYYTPVYAVELIERYLKPHSKILCPFDTVDSNFVKYLSLKGHYVSYSHIVSGIDFFSFTKEQVKDYDYIVSNPPFSDKTLMGENEYPQCPFTWDKENEQWIM
jgi:hypothetical protein